MHVQKMVLCALLLAGAASVAASEYVPAGTPAGSAADSAMERAVRRNLAAPWVLAPAAVDSLLAAESDLPTSERIDRWARRFLAAGGAEYRFGPEPGGYVAQGALVDDAHHDCVSLLYRVVELARAESAADAVRLALALRFAGAPPESVVAQDGRVDYERPEHLDFSLDMVRAGHWGRDITAGLPGAVRDRAGSARYPPGSFWYLPAAAVAGAGLREGDIAWLVLSPAHEAARRLRQEHGLVIGHIGVIAVEPQQPRRPWLVHAASSALGGWYAGGRIAKVPLAIYLRRVERFAGVLITRFENEAAARP